jgi:2-iminobutanoate/2-iminopropanoate deaminase
MKLKTTLLSMLLVSPFAHAGSPEIEYHAIDLDRPMPFSEAVRVGHMLYLSGMIGNVGGTMELAEGGIRGETRQALENIKATLEKYDSSMAEVVKCTVFLADIADWGDMNTVYVEYFHTNPPARSALGSSGLALGSRVEIECFATVK